MSLDVKDRWEAYTRPFVVLRFALGYLLQSLWLGRSDARDHAFASFYADIGRNFAKREEESSVPRLVASASGVVLDLGPGSGNQLPRFTASAVSTIYGLEPNGNFVDILEARVKDYPDLAGKYKVITAGLGDQEVLDSLGIREGTVDTVVCMQVLCSVSDPDLAAKQMYKLLRPGGQLVFWEHQRSGETVTRVIQKLWGYVWRPLMGGCCFDNEVEKAVLGAGEWDVLELGKDGFEGKDQKYSLLPHTWGRLVKRGV